jgi:hypothetical protein
MAIVEDKSSALPILQAEKTQSDNVRIMPIIPWEFAAVFLGIAITMTMMPDARRVIFGLKRCSLHCSS